MVLNEKTVNLMVVNGLTGEILGHHSIPLFRKADLSMAYLVVCEDENQVGEQGQFLVSRSDVIYINEKHAIAVRACVEDPQGEELSLDEYTELIGLPVRYDDGTELGHLTELSYDAQTGAFDMAVVESERRTTELLRRQIESADNIEIVVRRRISAPEEKQQRGRIWFRRLGAEAPAAKEPAFEEPALEQPVPEQPAFEEPAFENPAPRKAPEEFAADENDRAIESLNALLREMEGFTKAVAPVMAEVESEGLFSAEPEKKKDLFEDLAEKKVAVEPQPEETIELNEKLELMPEGSVSRSKRAASTADNVSLYQQKFADEETEAPASDLPAEGPKRVKKKEKGGARSLWKFGS